MFIKTHSVKSSQHASQNQIVDQLMKTANQTGININDLAQKSHIRQSHVLPDPSRYLDFNPLQKVNDNYKEQLEEKINKIDNLDQIQENIKNIQLELIRIREDSSNIINNNSRQINELVGDKLNTFNQQIQKLSTTTNAVLIKSEALQSREALRDNILQIHDQALTNFTQVIQKLEQKVADLECQVINKQEMDQRFKALEHDIKLLFDQMQGRFSEMQAENNKSIGNVMGVMNVFEQKHRNLQMQLEQIRLILGK